MRERTPTILTSISASRLLWLRDTDVIKILEEQPSVCRVNCWEHKRHTMNERESILNQTPSMCAKYELTAVHTSVNKAAFGVHILVVWQGQDSMHSWHYATSVPSMSSSCPWLPSRVRDRKGAKSTNVSLSRGATFSKALSSFVVMLSKQTNQKSQKKTKLLRFSKDIREVTLCSSFMTKEGKELCWPHTLG